MRTIIVVILIIVGSNLCHSQRLKMSNEEIEDKKCEIVTQYFEFKKYVRTITDRTEYPRIRNSNEIALYRLLSSKFTTGEMKGGNREVFIKSLKNQTNTFGLLNRTYETFDCPIFDFISSVNPLSGDISLEVSNMNIIDPGKEVLTTKYRGSLYFSQIDMNSYNISKTLITNASKGIERKPQVKELKYEMYKLTESNYVLKINQIKNLENGTVPTLVPKSKKDTVLVTKYLKPDPEKFEPCCDQPKPPDTDGDGYNDLVDCEPNNKNIYPGANEIIADGIDQNCDGEDQIGNDADGDGYTVEACKSENEEIRKKCDCNDDDPDVYYRDITIPKEQWFTPYNGWNDDNCDCIVDEVVAFNWAELKTSDYLLVGKGHLQRGHPKPAIRNSVALFYSSAFLGSTGYAVYSKLKSNKFYSQHQEANTIRLSDINYSKANNFHKHFLISTGIAITVFGTQYFHLKVNNRKQKEYYEQIFDKEKARGADSRDLCTISFKPTIGDNYIGYGLFINLN